MTTQFMTIHDYAASPKRPLAGVAKVLRDESKIMSILPFADVGAMQIEVYHETGMAKSVAWRARGAIHGSVKGTTPKRVEEVAYSIGNEIAIDITDIKDNRPRIQNPITAQTNAVVKGIARGFSNALINGLPSLTAPTGLWYRLVNDKAAAQNITADPAGSTSGLDISPDASTLSTKFQSLLDKLDMLIYAVTNGSLDAEGKGVYLLCNATFIQRYQSMARQSGMLQYTQDALGRTWMSYKGAMFVDMGPGDDETDTDPGTQIITNVELLAGTALTGGSGTTVYAVKVGPEDFTAWQEYALDVGEVVQDPIHKVIFYQVIDWVVGIALVHPRAAARLYGLIAA